ncbi:hypothetical protein CXF68_12835 [Tenacibaculum sp. Bg11-29]|uniref:hypothetical protein n=1 Tax=Tenacibaculum sp. Bg11-29 TaxID=2058306 RepID=UPI000C32EA83|nr:hypothetical protein [Tenacibaculum sp. Bg11-29]PKH51517.1 hypothetical protein CXF68_12835 [Tenacibaculum sp. Bg11-29]
MDLDKYKKAWDNQPKETDTVSKVDIYKMAHSKSSSIVKWIFIIGILEFLILNSMYLFIDMDETNKEYEKLGLSEFMIYSQVIAYLILLYFLVMFYLNYKNISVTDSTKQLMSKIVKTRKTVKYYVLFNLLFMFIVAISVSIASVKSQPELNSSQILVFVLITTFILLVLLALLWLFYQLLYGILLKKLNKNYKELTKLEELN